MVAPYPSVDERRAREMLAELERMARSFLPVWSGATEQGDAGQALLRIAALLAEQVTSRLDRSPRRDAIAFFETLDIPPPVPMPARAPLVFSLVTNRESPVFAPARVQVAGKSLDGQEVLFETESGLELTPGRLEYLAAVDSRTDHIEEAPPGFLTLAPPELLPDYQVVTFSDVGSRLVQISPTEGLAENDVLRINSKAYTIEKGEKDGLLTLAEPLESSVQVGTDISKITRFESFSLRNLQKHEVYIGHTELLNLEQPSTITLVYYPAGTAERLRDLDVRFDLYGVKEGEDEPDWHPLKLVDTTAWEVILNKEWLGKVEALELGAPPARRWIRVRLPSQVEGRATEGTRITRLMLRVQSGISEEEKPCEDPAGSTDEDKKRNKIICCPPPATGTAAGSSTVPHAYHNANPLATTTRFHPFGPEPRRFDTFSLSAPEALSKKGATVKIDIGLVDSSPAVIEKAVITSGRPRAYAIGRNGRLQILAFTGTGALHRWQEFDEEQLIQASEKIAGGSGTIPEFELDTTTAPQALQVHSWAGLTDLVLGLGDRGRIWTAVVGASEKVEGLYEVKSFRLLDPPVEATEVGDVLLHVRTALPAPAALENVTTSRQPVTSKTGIHLSGPSDRPIVFVASNVGVHWRPLSGDGSFSGNWRRWPTGKGEPGENEPKIGPNMRFVRIWGNGRFAPEEEVDRLLFEDRQLVLIDDEGVVWVGTWVQGEDDIRWLRFSPDKSQLVSPDVRSTAVFGRDSKLSVVAALASGGDDDRQPFAIVDEQKGPTYVHPPETFSGQVESDTAIFSVPPVQGYSSDIPLTAAFVIEGEDRKLALWTSQDQFPTFDYPTAGIKQKSGIISDVGAGPPMLVLNGSAESIYRLRLTPVGKEIDFEAKDALVLVDDEDKGADFAELVVEENGSRIIQLDFTPAICHRCDETNSGTLKLRAFNVVLTEDERTSADSNNLWFDLYRAKVAPGGKPLAFIGKVSSDGNGWVLELDPKDEASELDSYLIIQWPTEEFEYRKSRVTEEVTDERIVVLDSALEFPDDVQEVTYHSTWIRTPTSQQVKPEHLSTLLLVEKVGDETPSKALSRTAIVLGDEAIPALNPIIHSDWQLTHGAYVLLGQAWETLPDTPTGQTITGAEPGDWLSSTFERGYQNPELAWEYSDGKSWKRLVPVSDSTQHLAISGCIELQVPDDLEPAEVAGKEDYWIRARLIGGDYGRAKYTVETSFDFPSKIQTQTITVDTSELRPPEILSIEACFELVECGLPEQVLVKNNVRLLDQTQASRVAEAELEMFEGAAALDADIQERGRTLYLGFSHPIEVPSLNLYVNAEEQEAEDELEFEVLARDGWRGLRLNERDATRGFHRRGVVKVNVDVGPRRARLFDRELYWLRVYPRQREVDWAPYLCGIYANAVMAIQAESISQELLGSSLGEPNQSFYLSKTPVLLDGLELRVRERLTDEEQRVLTAETGEDAVATYENIPGDWVRWTRADSFVGLNGDARAYRLDPATGEVRFGDGKQGRIPPGGRDGIRAVKYRSGGGRKGNLAHFSIDKLKSSIESVEAATNPIPSAGGVDALPIDQVIATAPARLRHRQQALTPRDIEAIALSWSPDVVRVRCLVPDEQDDRIRVVIARHRDEPRPQPSLVEREALGRFLRERAWGGLDERDILVTGPTYAPVSVQAVIVADSADKVSVLEKGATERLRQLLHPTGGGPDGGGWPFGRRIWQSDVLRALSGLEGLDRIEHVDIEPLNGTRLDDLAPTDLVCAKETDVTLTVQTRDGGI